MKIIALVIAGALSGTLVGCGAVPIATPFKVVDKPPLVADDSQELLVVITQTAVRDDKGKKKQFNEYVSNIESSLHQQHGLYGYTLRKELLGNRAWTMTIWYDEESMTNYKVSPPHGQAMASTGKLLKSATFARTKRRQSEVPPSWNEALRLIETEGRSYRF